MLVKGGGLFLLIFVFLFLLFVLMDCRVEKRDTLLAL